MKLQEIYMKLSLSQVLLWFMKFIRSKRKSTLKKKRKQGRGTEFLRKMLSLTSAQGALTFIFFLIKDAQIHLFKEVRKGKLKGILHLKQSFVSL